MVRPGTVDAYGVGIHYVDRGTGPAVMVLHGFSGSIEVMRPLIEELAARCRVVAIDLVGHGASDRPASSDAYSFARVAGMVSTVARTVVGEPFHLAGYSMGGRIALALAADDSTGLLSVATVGASAGIRDERARAARRSSDADLAAQIRERGAAWFADYWGGLPILHLEADDDGAERRRLAELRAANDPAALAHALEGLGQGTMPYILDQLAERDLPLLFVAGGRDEKYSDIARGLAAAVRNGDSRIIPDAGHNVPSDQPARLATELVAFFATAEVGTAA